MVQTAGYPFGVLVWDTSADIEETTKFVIACDELDWAIEMAECICSHGEQWAVIDLATMGIAARGENQSRGRPWHPAGGSVPDTH